MEITEGLRFKVGTVIYNIQNIKKKKLLEINSPMVADIYCDCNRIGEYDISYIKKHLENIKDWKII